MSPIASNCVFVPGGANPGLPKVGSETFVSCVRGLGQLFSDARNVDEFYQRGRLGKVVPQFWPLIRSGRILGGCSE